MSFENYFQNINSEEEDVLDENMEKQTFRKLPTSSLPFINKFLVFISFGSD